MEEITLTPLELIARIAVLVPPPRTHRHRYFGVLAPNLPLRAAAVALAAPVQSATAQADTSTMSEALPGLVSAAQAASPEPAHLSPRARRSGGFWITLVSTQNLHTYPRRAGHRCGMTALMRRWMTGCKSSQQTGIWRRKRHPTLRSISASVGEGTKE